jgi:small GTP-binding protein
MGLNDTPSGERVHIGFFGRRNAGKSSVVNAVTGQNLAIVSDQKGTTTDPVYKAMELLPLGPVMIIDTPGFDDEGKLGELRVRKAKQVLNKTDVAVLVVDAAEGMKECDRQLIELFRAKEINYIVAMNKSDLVPGHPAPAADEIYVSAETKDGVFELKERIAHLVPSDDMTKKPGGRPALPGRDRDNGGAHRLRRAEGRLILPQQQVIRDTLEADALAMVVKEDRVRQAIESLPASPPWW